MRKIRLEYGKSMYGGWYAQNIYQGIIIHTDTLKELKDNIKENFPWCCLGNRYDNCV